MSYQVGQVELVSSREYLRVPGDDIEESFTNILMDSRLLGGILTSSLDLRSCRRG